MEDNNLKNNFNLYLEEWKKHTATVMYSSTNEPMFECNAYRQIINLGVEALPLLRGLYNKKTKDSGLKTIQCRGIVQAVKEIVGDDFTVPKDIYGNVSAIKEYTQDWLDKNIKNYLKR